MVQRATILLAEDDSNDVLLMQRAFRKARLANPLQVVRDGEEAIRYLGGEAPYVDRSRYPFPLLVLLDLKMPKKSGFEVLEWLGDQPFRKELLVVVLTASNEKLHVDQAFRLGADSYLVKPAQFEELVAMVSRVNGYWLLVDKAPQGSPILVDAK